MSQKENDASEPDQSNDQDVVEGGFNQPSKDYKANPSIELYVQLRKENPEVPISISTSAAFEWLLSNDKKLRSFGIAPIDMAGALDSDGDSISKVSFRLLELLIDRRALISNGKTHVQSRGEAINDRLVNYLIAMMLDSLDWNDNLYIPRELIVLIKHQLGADTSAEITSHNVSEQRKNTASFAAQLRLQGKSGSMRQVAGLLKVPVSTVSRWFKDFDYESEVEKWIQLWDGPYITEEERQRRGWTVPMTKTRKPEPNPYKRAENSQNETDRSSRSKS